MPKDTNNEARLKRVIDTLSTRLDPLRQQLFNYREAGIQLGYSDRQIARFVAQGKIQVTTKLGRPKISAEEIERLLRPPVLPSGSKPKGKAAVCEGTTGRAAADEVRAALRNGRKKAR